LRSSRGSKSASILTLPEKNKIELVKDYISQLPNADQKDPPEENRIEIEKPLKSDAELNNMASLINSLQLPEAEIDIFTGNPLDFWFFMATFTWYLLTNNVF